MKQSENRFYVYVYLDPRKPGDYNYGEYHFDYEPFYVGKGKDGRMYDHIKINRQEMNGNKAFINKINKIQRKFDMKQYIIKYQDMLLEDVAYQLENKMEQIIGRNDLGLGPLCNLQDAGNGGVSGRIITEETRRKLSDAIKGKRCGYKNPMYGKHHTEETKQKMSLHLSGECNPMYGKKVSAETKKKMSENNSGKGNPMYGKHHTEETKQKIREARDRQTLKWRESYVT